MASRTRAQLNTLLAWLIGPLLLVLAEIGLRLWAPGLASPIVREVTFDGTEWFEINRAYLKKYFPPGNPLVPEFKPALIRRIKPPHSFRILCLGSSTMFGTPYQMTANIPGILRKQLRHAHPDKDIEVVNFGASAINSNVVLDLSHELAILDPDLVVVYLGHNEFYGPDGIGAGVLERNIPGFIRFKYQLRDLRVTTLLLNLIPMGVRNDEERNLMLEVSRRGSVHLDSDDARRVFEVFENNLNGIITFWKSNEVPVIISDISSNLMFPPFSSDTVTSSLTVSIPKLVEEFEHGRIDSCLAGMLQLQKQDSTNALIEYWLGRSFLSKEDTLSAGRFLRRARDHDLLKFRAPGRMNEIIRDVSEKLQVPFVSTDSTFAMMSRGGIPGDVLFWEHLHPTLLGYYTIAGLFHRKIEELNLVTGEASGRPPVISFAADSLSICWLDLAYGDLSIQRLTGRWPFTNYHREQIVFPKGPAALQNIARAVYERRISWDQGCYESATQFWRLGDLRNAATTYEALIEEYPSGYYPHYLLGNLYAKAGNASEAIRHLTASIASNPGYPNARLDLGLLQINIGLFDEAIMQLTTAADLAKATAPLHMRSNIQYGLAAAYANKGEYTRALRHVEESLRLVPTYRDALALREEILRVHP